MAHVALQNLHITPMQLVCMSQKEKAFIYASIDLQAEKESREAKKLSRRGRKG